jgi:hypothetical protein
MQFSFNTLTDEPPAHVDYSFHATAIVLTFLAGATY